MKGTKPFIRELLSPSCQFVRDELIDYGRVIDYGERYGVDRLEYGRVLGEVEWSGGAYPFVIGHLLICIEIHVLLNDLRHAVIQISPGN